MGILRMYPVPVNTQHPVTRTFEIKIILTSAGMSDWIIIPDEIQGISVTVQTTGDCTARLESTTSPLADVIDGIAIPLIWDDTEVRGTACNVFYPCTAIRMVQTGIGTSTLIMRAQ